MNYTTHYVTETLDPQTRDTAIKFWSNFILRYIDNPYLICSGFSGSSLAVGLQQHLYKFYGKSVPMYFIRRKNEYTVGGGNPIEYCLENQDNPTKHLIFIDDFIDMGNTFIYSIKKVAALLDKEFPEKDLALSIFTVTHGWDEDEWPCTDEEEEIIPPAAECKDLLKSLEIKLKYIISSRHYLRQLPRIITYEDYEVQTIVDSPIKDEQLLIPYKRFLSRVDSE